MIIKRYRIQIIEKQVIKSIRKKKTVRERTRCEGCYCHFKFYKVCKKSKYMYQTKYGIELPRPKYYCHTISSGLYNRSCII